MLRCLSGVSESTFFKTYTGLQMKILLNGNSVVNLLLDNFMHNELAMKVKLPSFSKAALRILSIHLLLAFTVSI